ncbi:MAG: FKBP-type peptidyl-prolyl cis-trans isomerase [Candidatus Nitrotoga sp.]|nr:FKBP-type peptidyl-prolyl cis-trans isomerase [Candidatus Nitrotoga sp.]
MHKIKALFFSGMFLLPMMLLTQNAFSAADNAATVVTKLIKIDHKVGDGKEAVAGKTVDVHYTGWLYSATAPNNKGTKFDSSLDRGARFSFPLGEGRVIKGWDQGVAGMKVGGQRTLIIPADLGYGARGAGSAIPPNAALIFDVELFGVH